MPGTPIDQQIQQPPVVLCAGGHDPAGGAGIIADGEAVRAAGAHAVTLVTCLTSQDTCGVKSILPQPPELLAEQWRRLVGDSPIAAVKIGLIGSLPLLETIAGLLPGRGEVPVVIDPVLASGAGDQFADAALRRALSAELLGRCALLTPNVPEAQALTGQGEPAACAEALLRTGCGAVLITGTHAEEATVVNRLYRPNGRCRAWRWPRLPYQYHGSGCTLASAVAARLAIGLDLAEAIGQAQTYTWETLLRARRTGRCQLTPDRLFGLDTSPAETR